MKVSNVKMPLSFSVEKAHRLQLELTKKIVREDVLPKKIRLIAGVDVAYFGCFSVGAAVVLDFESLKVKESETAVCRTRFPYIPTLLSFREVPPVISAIKKLKLNPDVFLVDGQGIMHPYRLGFASHLGLMIAKPTVGVAKSPLCGELQAFTEEGWAPITDKNEVIGAAVITKRGSKPVYVSIGNMVSLETAIAIVKHCSVASYLPEPTRQAHIMATSEKSKISRRVKEGCEGDC
ncbi:MAG TPA: endonuclease V [Candidatus Krumholzibacteriaceae bacterium]|nr:endonuclease V [Candidatus Krumholzibacteriaceae bacterium]